jgi:hypothetical protein
MTTTPAGPMSPAAAALRSLVVGTSTITSQPLLHALVEASAVGVPTGVAVRGLAGDLPELVIRMSTPEGALFLAQLLDLPDSEWVQVPSTRARSREVRWEDRPTSWVQSYSGALGGVVWVRLVATADEEWPELRRLTVGEADTIAALLGAVSL